MRPKGPSRASYAGGRTSIPDGSAATWLRWLGWRPTRTDSGVLGRVITAPAERLTRTLSPDDNALQVRLQRRATIVERLAGDVDDQTFRVPDLEEFGEPIPDDLPVINYL